MKKLLTLILLVFTILFGFGQTYNIADTLVTTCSGTFYDSGGNNNYSDKEDYTETFSPGTPGDMLRFVFTDFKTEQGYDYLEIYDGSNTSATLIGTYDGTNTPGTITATYNGDLTFVFQSDGSITEKGWEATISCVPPPINDLPCNATKLDIKTSCEYITYDNNGATDSGVDNPDCGSYNGSDVWFYVVINNSDDIIIDTDDGDITNGAMAIYSGSNCNNLSLIECDDNDSDNGDMPMIKESGDVQVSDTLWIRFWDYGGNDEGTFDICVYTIESINGDCRAAPTACSDSSIHSNSTGSGNYNELNSSNEGCLNGEHYSTWIYFHAETGGLIEFTIHPNNEDGHDDDYDFAVWQSSSCPPNDDPIRCSFSAVKDDTGTRQDADDVSENSGGDSWVKGIQASDGDEFLMIIDNYSQDTNSFTLTWQLSEGATLDCTPLPVSFLSSDYDCSRKTLTWETASEINNDYFTINIGSEYDKDGLIVEETKIVHGTGNSNTITSYESNINAKDKYLELYQTDYDGTTILLKITHPICKTDEKTISLYPNPTERDVYIEGDYNTIKAYNMIGKEININIVDNKITGLDTGFYVVVVDGYYRIELIVN